ncbi:hypothetical protein D0T24_17235 [Duganella sp. BJB480]|nr:hypothetical protein D0T24_17235 [Duganella sp. BJB480]
MVLLVIHTSIRGDEVAVVYASFKNMGCVRYVFVTFTFPNKDFVNHPPFSFLVFGWVYGEGEKHTACLVSCWFGCARVVHFILDGSGHYENRFTGFVQRKDAVYIGIVVMCDEHAVIKIVDGIAHAALLPAKIEHVWFAERVHFSSPRWIGQ